MRISWVFIVKYIMGWLIRTKQGGEGIVHQTGANMNRHHYSLGRGGYLPNQNLAGPQNFIIE